MRETTNDECFQEQMYSHGIKHGPGRLMESDGRVHNYCYKDDDLDGFEVFYAPDGSIESTNQN